MRVFAACPACAPDGVALKDGAKVLGVRRTESGIVGLRRDKGGLGWIKGDNGAGGVGVGGSEMEKNCLGFGKFSYICGSGQRLLFAVKCYIYN